MMKQYICETCGGKVFSLRKTGDPAKAVAVCNACGKSVEQPITLDKKQ